MSEYVETDRDKGNEDVTKKEAFQYKFCTGTVYRRADENLKIRNSGFERGRHSCVCRGKNALELAFRYCP